MQKPFLDLSGALNGARVCLMGGADSLEDDIDGIGADAWVSINEHGVLLRTVDYIITMDDRHGRNASMVELIREHSEAPIISPCDYADYKLSGWPGSPNKSYAGLVAIWVAQQMGAKAVFLAGFDGYSVDPSFMAKAELMAKSIHIPVREIGGRMGHWDEYRKAERFRAAEAVEDIRIAIIVVKATNISGIDVKPGDRLTADPGDVKALLRHGMVKPA